VLLALVVDEEVGASYLGVRKMLPEENGPILIVRHPKDATSGPRVAVALCFSVHGCKQRPERGLDWDAPRLAALGRFDLARLSVDRLVYLDDAVLQVDVLPGEGFEAPRPA
jgi:hypothetical protein